MEETNPYRAPSSFEPGAPPPTAAERRRPLRLLAGWTAVCLFNVPLPLLLGWVLTRRHGRGGMAAGAAILLLLGGGICAAWRKFGRALVIGGIPIALSQLIPILQMMAGIIALVGGEWLGQVQDDDAVVMQIRSEFGGFVVTIITGTLLMAASILVGLFIQAVTPIRWRKKAPRDSA